MNVHKNARLTPSGRALLARRVASGWTAKAAAEAAGVSLRTARKWIERHRRGGERRHHDRSSAPRRCPRRVAEQRIAEIERLRRQRMTGPAIAQALGMARSTVGLVLRRLGLGKLRALEPKPAIVRYERARPGEMIHLTSRSWARSTVSAIASPAAGQGPTTWAAAGTSCMSASMTLPGWPTPRSCPRKVRPTPPPSWCGRWPGSADTASPSNG